MRLRFTIRDLLWLTALVAVCVAWWVEHRSIVDERAVLRQHLDKVKDTEVRFNVELNVLRGERAEVNAMRENLKAK